MKKYSEIKKFNGRDYRYDYKNCWLEFVYENEDKEITMIDAIGLSKENWETGNDYWIEMYDMELEEEFATMMANEI